MQKSHCLFLSCLLVVSTGCTVLDSTRRACEHAGLDDASIDLLFQAAESNRDLGLSKEDSATNILATCGGNPDCPNAITTCSSSPDCLDCLNRILDEFYP